MSKIQWAQQMKYGFHYSKTCQRKNLKDITFILKKINFAQFMKINRLNPTFTKLIFEIIFLYNILWVYTFYKYNTVLIRGTCLFLFLFSKFHTLYALLNLIPDLFPCFKIIEKKLSTQYSVTLTIIFNKAIVSLRYKSNTYKVSEGPLWSWSYGNWIYNYLHN